VVRSLDSTRSLKGLINIFEKYQLPFEIVHNNLCLFREGIRKSIDNDLFTGFDEVWLFKSYPPEKTLINIPYSTSDQFFYQKKLEETVVEKFKETDCCLLLADGEKLICLSKKKDLMKEFV